MTVRAVFFDMGGTIEKFSYTPELRLNATAGLNGLLQSFGIDLGLTQEQLFALVSTGHHKYHVWSMATMQELPALEVWGKFILPDFSVDSDRLAAASEELMFYLESNYYEREMRAEVPSVLSAIKKMGLQMGLISNVCSRDLVPDNLTQYGIIQYFDPIVLSSIYGRRKPDPAIFHYAARLAGVPTSECLYIGDRIARDIVGARRAGFKMAVQIVNDFAHGETDEGAEPDAIIQDMTELIDILQTQSKPTQKQDHPNKVKAILFDAGDILYFRPRRGQHLQKFIQENQLDKMDVSLEDQENFKRQAYHGEITHEQYREKYLQTYGLVDPALIEQGKKCMELDDNDIQFFQGVPETLIKLKEEGFLLGIITDTAVPLSIKLGWFERGGFGHVWDSLVSSREVGVEKPDPKMYRTALQQMGVTVDQAVFVGHSPEELAGATALGIRTIAINGDISAKADYHLKDFTDILKIPIFHLNGNLNRVVSS